MMITKIYTAAVIGIETQLVTVEIMVKHRKHEFVIVGMGDKSVQESKKRIKAALECLGIRLDYYSITVNLAPTHLRKMGSSFDLPIAVGILQALGKIDLTEEFIKESLFLGEISLDGSILSVKSAMTVSLDAADLNKKRLILPLENYREASLVKKIESVGVESLKDLQDYFTSKEWTQRKVAPIKHSTKIVHDFDDVIGQLQPKRMLEIAVAGNHNVILIGPPGCGKTMIAKSIISIMPPMTPAEITQTTRIYSASSSFKNALITNRPFRSPHHGISAPGLIGGGSPVQPGEISLAHNGILFLDELTEFKRSVIESLRQPLEDKTVTISRANSTLTLPASFMLIAAMNPCPCGYLGDNKKKCFCSGLTIHSYLKKISDPFLDRIDLQLFLRSIDITELCEKNKNKMVPTIKKNILKARDIQYKRSEGTVYNAQITPKQIETYCPMTTQARKILHICFDKFNMTMRSYHKIIRVARTIADLAGAHIIEENHIKEAFMYRGIDQKLRSLQGQ